MTQGTPWYTAVTSNTVDDTHVETLSKRLCADHIHNNIIWIYTAYPNIPFADHPHYGITHNNITRLSLSLRPRRTSPLLLVVVIVSSPSLFTLCELMVVKRSFPFLYTHTSTSRCTRTPRHCRGAYKRIQCALYIIIIIIIGSYRKLFIISLDRIVKITITFIVRKLYNILLDIMYWRSYWPTGSVPVAGLFAV